MTELPFDKYQMKGPMDDESYKVLFDLPETAKDQLGGLINQERTGYIIVMTEEEYEMTRRTG